MHQVRHRRGSAVAFVAACVLVLQSFLSAWAASAMPATPTLDIFGNPLCITSVDHDASGQPGDQSAVQNCCAFGCASASPLPEPPGGEAGLLRPLLAHSGLRFHAGDEVRGDSPDHDPGSPRAPPLTA